ncbi:Uncharacterised protein [Legionella sainthelensi]|nr:hypothetical protein [Legionella sainthelensi]VEB35666.1 Uncharacterised protein [Legionella sainthelensi]
MKPNTCIQYKDKNMPEIFLLDKLKRYLVGLSTPLEAKKLCWVYYGL